MRKRWLGDAFPFALGVGDKWAVSSDAEFHLRGDSGQIPRKDV